MGLDDIDEDEKPKAAPGPKPTVKSSGTAALDLDALFGGLGKVATPPPPRATTASPPVTGTPPLASPTAANSGQPKDALDDFFLAPGIHGSPAGPSVSHGLPSAPSDLMDFSKGPAVKTKIPRNFEQAVADIDRRLNGKAPIEHQATLADFVDAETSKMPFVPTLQMLQLMNFYDVLAVAPSASAEEISRSYRNIALHLHPDKRRARNAKPITEAEEEFFKVVTKANETLSDPEERKKYDLSLSGPKKKADDQDWFSNLS